MMSTVISVENLSKSYRLGQIGSGTLTNDLKVWWAKARGKPNPLLKIGQQDHGSRDGEEVWALRDVSFQVEQGEVLGVIGRNGAGKSTLLKILSRVTAPTCGQVKVKGRIASLLEVGTGFHPELTGRENIYLNGAILGMRKAEVARKFDEIVAFAEVEKFIDTPVKRYSSGMYVRLAFAVAAHLESEILLVDEVLAVGDADFQKKCLGKMGDVASHEGRTVLFVSHNMTAIQQLCTQCNLFLSGQIVSHGYKDDVIRQYLNSFDNNSKMNLRASDDKDYQVGVRVLNHENQVTKMWRYDTDLIIEVSIESKAPIYNPAVDLSFYDGKTRLFSLQSDLIDDGPDVINGKTVLNFRISNPGFIGAEMHFDVGLRQGKSDYFVLLREVGRISPDDKSFPKYSSVHSLLRPKTSLSWKN